ncbi:terminase gpA endonuclease subunit [Serratia sp. PAMC26656]|uniref:terminase gpA endonuclease subunit n=1 Tax=Serratia sp. PAMC26656 TaxID=2775909 RepID=UPI0018F3D551|nr:terminase gpA endonuclease subunit [Serratia sp. PAMC26656]MBJ7893985.1 phage terminase large subunit family protein [Serratia sp. PAMC26656]
MKKFKKIYKKTIKKILPPEKILPSKFAEQHLVFPDGRLAGQKLRLFEFQRQVLDTIIEPGVQRIVMMSSAQLLKSTVMMAAMQYFIVNDPSNMAYGFQSGASTMKFKNGKWQPSIDQSILRDYVTKKSDKNAANNQNTQQNLDSTNTYFINLNAPSTLRGITTKRIFLDEVSGSFDDSEGDPISLASQRIKSFDDGLIMIGSTPTNKLDAIVQEYEAGDQRKFHVPCPNCNHYHELVWENVRFDWQVLPNGRKKAVPETAKLLCPNCEHHITEGERVRAIAAGHWLATNPSGKYPSYHVSRLYSPINTIESTVEDFSNAHYNFDLQSFYNNSLGLPYEPEENKEHNLIELENLREEISSVQIPENCLGILFGADQQNDRIEITTLAFTEKTLYVLDHRSFYGVDCTQIGSKAYTELTLYSKGVFKTVSGRPVRVLAGFLDSSNGNATQTVYTYCNSYNPLFKPIKGEGCSTTKPLFRSSRTGGHELQILNVNLAKSTINKMLRTCLVDKNNPPIRFSEALPDDYFNQLTSERVDIKNGFKQWSLKVSGSRNEALDCLVYAFICMKHYLNTLTGADPFHILREYNHRVRNKYNETTNTSNESPPERKQEPPQPKRLRRRNSFWN